MIDLDLLIQLLTPDLRRWQGEVDSVRVTWRDRTATWPQPLESDRAVVVDPESVGIELLRAPDATGLHECRVVVWTGGWADVEWVAGERVVTRTPQFPDLEGAEAAVRLALEEWRRAVAPSA